MNTVTRTERGWPAHFILADRCTFRRNTLLECSDGQAVVVSTVGRCVEPDGTTIMKIGADRYFETMAFMGTLAEYPDGTEYMEANVSRSAYFNGAWSVDHIEPSASGEANENHERAVADITRRLEAGEQVEEED